MIPLKNKKKNLEFTVSEIRDFSLKYIEKYAPSKQQLRTYLLKKYLKSGSTNMKKGNYQNLIDIVLSDLEQSKFINDKFYSESKAKNLIQRGSSINKIRSFLMSKGINDKFVKETLDKIKENNESKIDGRMWSDATRTPRSRWSWSRWHFVATSLGHRLDVVGII